MRMKARRSLGVNQYGIHRGPGSSRVLAAHGETHCFRPWRYFIISMPHSARLALPYPGISSKTTFDSPPFVPPIPNAFISLVRPGFDDVQQISWPMIAFNKELFPTFDRPRNATSGSIEERGVVRNLLADHSFIGEWRDGMNSLFAKASWSALGALVSQ